MARVLLVLLLVNGLVPSLSELVETLAHRVTAGHFAHSIEHDSDLGEQGSEHGCGTTAHLCRCCPSQHVAPVARVSPPAAGAGLDGGPCWVAVAPVTGDFAPPLFRPPIG
jgi:hypothetical protein